MRNRYRFTLRTMHVPRDTFTFEAGPFTRLEAVEHAQAAVAKRTMTTGVLWTYDLNPIVEASPVSSDGGSQSVFIFAALVIAAIVLMWWRFQ